MIVIQEETWDNCKHEIEELGKLHFIEVRGSWTNLKYIPNTKLYELVDESKLLAVVTLRDVNKLVGYSVILLMQDHVCTNNLVSNSALLFVHKDYRGHSSLKLIKATEELAKSHKACYHVWGIKPENDFSKYLIRNGYKLRDIQYIKYLGGT